MKLRRSKRTLIRKAALAGLAGLAFAGAAVAARRWRRKTKEKTMTTPERNDELDTTATEPGNGEGDGSQGDPGQTQPMTPVDPAGGDGQ